MAEEGTSITNSGATTDVENNYEICQRSGFRVKKHTLVREEFTGAWVRPDSAENRHPQDFVRARRESQHGAVNPEPIGQENFISTAVTADDL